MEEHGIISGNVIYSSMFFRAIPMCIVIAQ